MFILKQEMSRFKRDVVALESIDDWALELAVEISESLITRKKIISEAVDSNAN